MVNVQVINVCDDAGQNCALSSPYAGIGYNPVAIQRIFDQAGVTVNLLAPVTYNSTAFLRPAIVDAPAQGYIFGSPTDPAHQLMNLPGHGQNLNRDVLNLWLVDTLPHNPDASGVSTAPQPFGMALTYSNGAIGTTGNNGSGFIAGIDNIAHELAHNLGLSHTDGAALAGTTVAAGAVVTAPAPPGTYANEVQVDSSANLLRGTGRLVPRDPCAIATPTCANVTPPAGKDQLLPFQQEQIRTAANDLFSVSGLTANAKIAKRTFENCTVLSINCSFDVNITPAPVATQSLTGFKVRFLTDVGSFSDNQVYNNFFNDCILTFSGAAPLPNGGSELAFSLAFPLGSGCSSTATENRVVLTSNTPGKYVPFSFEFDFSSGLTSRAAFNSDGVADSTKPFYLSRGDVPPDSVGLTIPTDPVLFNKAFEYDVQSGDPLPVPEPAAALLFAPAIAATLMFSLPFFKRRRWP